MTLLIITYIDTDDNQIEDDHDDHDNHDDHDDHDDYDDYDDQRKNMNYSDNEE
jgi:hypothetical protein